MMKTITLMAGLAMLGLLAASCDKSFPAGTDGAEAGESLLTVRFDDPSTKKPDQSLTNEKLIQNVQIFVFRAGSGADAGILDVAASAGFDTPLGISSGSYSGITLRCSTGLREVWAVVNDSRNRTEGVNAVKTREEFLALTHELQDASPTKLLMIGHSGTSLEPSVTLPEGSVNLSIDVHRLAASVILESVVNDLTAPAYRNPDSFRLESCYLINVPGQINFAESTVPSALPADLWYAKLAAETASPRADLIYDSIGGKVLNAGGTYSVKHTFYTYPNDCAVSESASWTPRATLLVLEASIKYGSDWTKYYYPVQLSKGPLCSNRQYHVNLVIHRPGSLNPNQPVTLRDVTPIISVVNWEDGDHYSQEI